MGGGGRVGGPALIDKLVLAPPEPLGQLPIGQLAIGQLEPQATPEAPEHVFNVF